MPNFGLSSKFSQAVAGLVFTAFAICGSSSARGNIVTNGSFESGSYTFGADGGVDLPAGSTAITGWTVVTNDVAALGPANIYPILAKDGGTSLDLQGYTDSAPYGGVSQTLDTISGHTYDVTFWIGVQNGLSYAVGPAAISVSAASTPAQTFTNTSTLAGEQWEKFDYDFTATAASTLLTFEGQSTAGGAYIGLDNVDVEDTATASSVPLPAAVWTGLPLMLAIVIVRRKNSIRAA
jgi:hypothetical protein